MLKAQVDYDSIPLHEYKFSYQINAEYASKAARVSRIAQYFSYIGQDMEALQVPNEVELEWGFDTLTEADKTYFQAFQPVNAVDYIIERAAQEQIIIINEAHHKPRHRVFTHQLLEGLYEQGYRYFGMEMLLNDFQDTSSLLHDTLLMERGFPLNSQITGAYILEPQMANLVRKALQLGFTLFAYERTQKGNRELFQASNIKRKILDRDPSAKLLIHCGWYHALESENRDKKWMAQYLRELTGINPFTIYQDLLIERHCTQESPFYSLMEADEPTVFVNDQGQPYNGKQDFDKFDVLLYHPRTTYIFNRPDWLLDIEGNQIYHLDRRRIGLDYPVMIKAFKSDEIPQATPIDIIEIESQWDLTALVLPPGTYRLELTNTLRKVKELKISIKE